MMRAVHVTETDAEYLYLAFHHMVFDGLSLHVLLEELDALLTGRGLRRAAPSFAGWLAHLRELSSAEAVGPARKRWEAQLARGMPELPPQRRTGPNRLELTRSETTRLDLAKVLGQRFDPEEVETVLAQDARVARASCR